MYEMRSTLDVGVLHSLPPALACSIHFAPGDAKTRQIFRTTVWWQKAGVDACSCPQGHAVNSTAALCMGSSCAWCCHICIFVIPTQAGCSFGSRHRTKHPLTRTTWDHLAIQLYPDTCLLHWSYRCKTTPHCEGEKGKQSSPSRSLLCISLAVWANVYWFFVCAKKPPVSCTPSQGGVHTLLVTASLQKILSDREHAAVLNHPPLSKQSHRSSWEAATWLLRPFHVTATSVLGFSWEQSWPPPLPAAEAGTIPAKPGHQGPPCLAAAPWTGAPRCRMRPGQGCIASGPSGQHAWKEWSGAALSDSQELGLLRLQVCVSSEASSLQF